MSELKIAIKSKPKEQRVHADCPYCQCKQKKKFNNNNLLVFFWLVTFIYAGFAIWQIAGSF